MFEDVEKLRHRGLILQQAHGFDGGELHFLVEVAQQERDARRRGFVANFLQRDQRFKNHVGVFVFRAQCRHQIGNSRFTAQDTQRAGCVGARLHAGPAAHQGGEGLDHIRARNDECVYHLIVGVGEFAFDACADALERSTKASLDVTRQIEIDQAVGGANLHFGIVIGGSLDERC